MSQSQSQSSSKGAGQEPGWGWRMFAWPLAALAAVWAERVCLRARDLECEPDLHKRRLRCGAHDVKLLSQRHLDDAERAVAARMGVTSPERVHVVILSAMPWPGPAWLHRAISKCGFPARESIGLSLGYVIFLRPEVANHPKVLAHELVHTAQCERLGGVRPFLHRYLAECLAFGYAAAPLEHEARVGAVAG